MQDRYQRRLRDWPEHLEDEPSFCPRPPQIDVPSRGHPPWAGAFSTSTDLSCQGIISSFSIRRPRNDAKYPS